MEINQNLVITLTARNAQVRLHVIIIIINHHKLTARHVQVARLLVEGEECEVHAAGADQGDPATWTHNEHYEHYEHYEERNKRL